MEINKELFDKIAHLARLEFTDEESESMMKDMSKIISWVEKLDELDTSDIDPMSSMTREKNVFRSDENGIHIDRNKALANAPHSTDGYFVVPKVID